MEEKLARYRAAKQSQANCTAEYTEKPQDYLKSLFSRFKDSQAKNCPEFKGVKAEDSCVDEKERTSSNGDSVSCINSL